jgi:type VI protein secretion system component Hcp
LSASAPSSHDLSLVAFTINIAESNFRHTQAAKENKVSHQDISITKKFDKASPMTNPPPPAGPVALPYPNSGGSKNKK